VLDPLEFLYAPNGGLTILSTIVLAALAAGIVLSGQGERVSVARRGFQEKTGAERTRQNAIFIGVAALLLILIPLGSGKITQELLANIGIFLLLALGLNIVVGLAGILDLGYVAFFAVGGYTTAVLTSPNRGENWPSWVPVLDGPGGWLIALAVTIVVAALTGLFIGAPVIRMRGDYLAIVTLGFGEIIRLLFLSDWLNGYFNGAQGITNIPPADFGLFDVKGTDPRSVFYLVLVFAVLSIYTSWRLEKSRLGRAWMAIREDESVAEAMGINTVNVKLMAFVVGAVLASFSGAIFSAKVGSIFPTSFEILVSIIILVIVIVGGMGNILGVIAGSVVLVGILGGPKQPGLLQEFSEYKLLIYGALLIWMMLQRPEGLIPNARRSRELHQDEFLQDAWLRGQVDADEEESAADSGAVPGPGGAMPAGGAS
jgi:branched-chain amino acid transport system permease protein